jgi:hypothetical protein
VRRSIDCQRIEIGEIVMGSWDRYVRGWSVGAEGSIASVL